jgi:AcrR family transcriptional regulator
MIPRITTTTTRMTAGEIPVGLLEAEVGWGIGRSVMWDTASHFLGDGTRCPTFCHAVGVSTSAQPRADVARNREAILTAAQVVLTSAPAATMQEVAEASGVGRSTLYRHFPDRDALVIALLERLLAESGAIAAAHIADAAGKDPVEVLVAIGEEQSRLGDRYGFIERDEVRRHARGSAGRRVRIRRLRDFVRAGQAAGAIRDDLAAPWLVTMFGLAVGEASDRRAPDTKDRQAALAPTIRSLLRPPA